MPELPEVESVRRQLAPALIGRRIVSCGHDPHPHARFHAIERVRGTQVDAVGRRGKYLVLPLGSGQGPLELILHLGMSGSLRLTGPRDPHGRRDPEGQRDRGHRHADPYDRAWFDLDDGRTLRFRDPRRFGRVSVVAAGDYRPIVPTLAELGPEPLSADFDPARFARSLSRTKAPIKAVLLGQRVVAGVGNIYADEALWHAGIHPASRRVGVARAHRLHAAIVDILQAAIEREGTTFRDYQMVNGQSGRYASELSAYGKAGQPCRRCAAPMRRTVVAQRGTTFCPRCQHH